MKKRFMIYVLEDRHIMTSGNSSIRILCLKELIKRKFESITEAETELGKFMEDEPEDAKGERFTILPIYESK